MEQKIIVLRGRYNTGKTTTLLRVLKEFFNIKKKKDIFLKFKYKEYKIAVFTGGDEKSIIKKKWDELNDDFDLLICCCRSRGKTYQFFRNLEFNYNICFINKKLIGKEIISDDKALEKIKNQIPFEVGNKDINSEEITYL